MLYRIVSIYILCLLLEFFMINTRIAFDLGGVIIRREAVENFLIPESDISVKLAVQKFGAENVFIISKAKDKYIQRNIDLLNNVKFFAATGLKP